MLNENLKEKIEELVGNAYEVGHAHGSASMELFLGKEPKKTNEGWYQYFEEIIRLLENELKEC